MFLDMNPTVTADLELFARAFHALADRKRLEIVRLLTNGERCVCELTPVVGAKQPLLSFHLKTLKEAGLVRDRRCGKWVYYSLNYEILSTMQALIGKMMEVPEHFDSCCCESLCGPTSKNSKQDRGQHEE